MMKRIVELSLTESHYAVQDKHAEHMSVFMSSTPSRKQVRPMTPLTIPFEIPCKTEHAQRQ